MRSYDPTEVTVSYNGTPIDGFGPATFIKVNRNEDAYTLQMGNSGTGARSKNPNKSGTVEITLLMSSPANGLLTAIQQLDEASGEGVGEFLVKDRSTAAAKCQAQNCWIKKPPDFERGKEVGEVTWTLESDNIDILHDGLIDA